MSALSQLNEETVRRNNALTEQEQDSIFNKLNPQKLQSVTPLEDGLLAAVDNNRAYQDARMKSPSYMAEQNKMNIQSFAKALQDTKQVKGMSYNGNAVKQGSDSKYYTADGNEVTDVANIQKDYQFDPIVGATNSMLQGNPLAMQSFQEQSKPQTHASQVDRLQEILLKGQMAKEVADAKPKKDTDLKPKDIKLTLDNMGANDLPKDQKDILFAQLNEASNDPKKYDAIVSNATANTFNPTWDQYLKYALEGGLAGAGVGAVSGSLGGPGGALAGAGIGSIVGATVPLTVGKRLKMDKFTEAMQNYK